MMAASSTTSTAYSLALVRDLYDYSRKINAEVEGLANLNDLLLDFLLVENIWRLPSQSPV